MGKLIQNAVYCSESDKYYISTHVHDYVSFTSSGHECFIDGGTYYQRSTLMPSTVSDWCLYDDSPRELVKERILWGTYGKEGKDPLKHVPLSKCETDHLQAILRTQSHIGPFVRDLICEILKDRGVEPENAIHTFAVMEAKASIEISEKKNELEN
jgi:hypothetical protein